MTYGAVTVEIIIVIYVEWHMVPMLSDRMAVCISVDRPYGGLDHRKFWKKSFNLLIVEWHMVPMLSDRMAVCISVDHSYGGLDHKKCWKKSLNLLIRRVTYGVHFK